MIPRRKALRNTAVATALISSAPALLAQNQLPKPPPAPNQPPPPSGPHQLPPLPYAYDALEPYIDAQTMQIHHDKHHAAYVNNLNKALADFPQASKRSIGGLLRNIPDFPEAVRPLIRNNGGGHYNHYIFWQMMKKGGGGAPRGELAQAIDRSFGSFSRFQEDFTKAATSVFGSGWAWLTEGPNDMLQIETSANQDSPWMMHGRIPFLGIDVWEHAYYLKYQNRRPEYVQAFFKVINWDAVAERYKKRE